VAINCAAFSKDLLESEMFGHKAGAFTGASKDQKGLFEEANNGTIFLDEIGEMAIDLQAKLLRVIETGEFLKVGENKPTKINVRIIAATNRNLQKEIEAGHFREDLFYRISVFQIQLPALRERVSDIEDLAKHFILHFATKSKKNINSISTDCLDALKLHEWNGNIRELKNVIERSIILMENGDWKMENLPFDFQTQNNSLDKLNEKGISAFSMSAAEQLHIRKILNHTNGNKTKTAELLGIALTTLYRKLEEYKIV
jgi:two-component system NtrC family response regulator